MRLWFYTSKKLRNGLNDAELSKVGALVDGHSIEVSYYTRGEAKLLIVKIGCYLTKLGRPRLNFKDGKVLAEVSQLDYNTAKNYQLNTDG